MTKGGGMGGGGGRGGGGGEGEATWLGVVCRGVADAIVVLSTCLITQSSEGLGYRSVFSGQPSSTRLAAVWCRS